jgi:hypothetical protein
MLTAWRRSFDLEAEIRKILVRSGAEDVSTLACQRWATEFIQDLIPAWRPGQPLGPLQRIWVGQAFEREQRSVVRWQKRIRKMGQ